MNDDLRQYALSLATQHGVDPSLVDAIGQTESGWKPNAVSSKGAMGPMQLMPATAKSLGVDPSDPFDNVRGGVMYLKQLQDQFGNNPTLIAAGYNAGPTAVRNAGGVPNYPETQRYVQKVTGAMPIDPSKVVPDQPAIDPGQVVLDRAPQASPDDNLPTTLNIAGYDTGVRIPSSVSAALVGTGRSLDRLQAGIRQLLPFTDQTALAQDQQRADQLYAPLKAVHPVATFLGEAAPGMATINPVLMGAQAGLGYGSPMARLMNAGGAYAGGRIGQAVGNTVARAFGPRSMSGAASDINDFIVDNASNQWGIPLTAGQTGGKPAQIAESVLANLPGSAGVIAKARGQTFSAFNRAVGNTFGADSTQLLPDVVGQYQKSIGKTIGNLADRNTLNVDPQFAQEFAAASQRAQTQLVGDNQALANKWFNNVQNAIDPETGTIPGTVYKALRSDLGTAASGAQGTVQNVLGDLRGTLTRGMDRSITPDDAAAWRLANQQYFNVKQVGDALAKTPDGNISPTQLLSAVNRAQPNARFGAGNDLADLAQWAKTTLPDKIPNSGTAQRMLYQKLLTNPLGTVATLGAGAYGIDKAGVSPDWALALAAPFFVARGMAGKPLGNAAASTLKGLGGLLGYDASTAATASASR